MNPYMRVPHSLIRYLPLCTFLFVYNHIAQYGYGMCMHNVALLAL